MLNVKLFNFNKQKNQQGFTLVEIMVAVSIFTIVVTVGMGALLTVNNAYGKSKDTRQAVASVSSAIEYMLREMRTGHSFICDNYYVLLPLGAGDPPPQDCFNNPPGPSDGITFLDQDENQQTITFNPTSAGTVGQIFKNGNQAITDPSIVDINDVKFYVRGLGDTAPNYVQPIIVVRVEGSVIGQSNSNFTFQSSISQRLLDVE